MGCKKILLGSRVFFMVGREGVEPSWSFPPGILSPLRIPFRHRSMREKGSKGRRDCHICDFYVIFCFLACTRFSLNRCLSDIESFSVAYENVIAGSSRMCDARNLRIS